MPLAQNYNDDMSLLASDATKRATTAGPGRAYAIGLRISVSTAAFYSFILEVKREKKILLNETRRFLYLAFLRSVGQMALVFVFA